MLFAPLAAIMALRQPRHPVGWLLGAGALSIAASQFAQAYGVCALLVCSGRLPFGGLGVWIGNTTWPVVWAPLLLLLLVFPTGTFPSRSGRYLAWASVLFMLLEVTVAAVMPGPMPLSNTIFTSFENPTGIPWFPRDALMQFLLGPAFGIQLLLFLGVVVVMIRRFWRSAGIERQQLKWLMYAAAMFLVAEVIASTGALGGWSQLLANITSLGVPLAITIAIVRHRLLDIDVVIKRTLVYGFLSVLLLMAYWLGVVLLQRVLRPFTTGSDLTLVGSTMAVVALFQPLRRWVQMRVDRHFYRHHYDAERTLQALTARLRDEVDLDTVSLELMHAVQQTIHPAQVSVWLRPTSQHEQAR